MSIQAKVTIKCIYGIEVNLKAVGGQYQFTYQGECDCGRIWSLEEVSEALKEIQE